MSFAALCELVQARGWTIALMLAHAGPDIGPCDEWAAPRAIVIYETKADLRAHGPALIAARLDGDAPLSIDQGASVIAARLAQAGVLKGET